MINKYNKGARAERELINMFWENGFAAARIAGSGVSRHPCPDVVAGNGKKKFALECKSTKSDYIHLTREEITKLLTFSQTFGADPYVAVRFEGRDWIFLDMAAVQNTKSGENFKVSKDFAYNDGKRFEKLLETITKEELFKEVI